MLCEIRTRACDDLKNVQYIQFVLSSDNYTIALGIGGHDDILRGFNLSSQDYRYGGYINMVKKAIMPHTGTVEDIPKSLWEIVQADLEEFFDTRFSVCCLR